MIALLLVEVLFVALVLVRLELRLAGLAGGGVLLAALHPGRTPSSLRSCSRWPVAGRLQLVEELLGSAPWSRSRSPP